MRKYAVWFAVTRMVGTALGPGRNWQWTVAARFTSSTSKENVMTCNPIYGGLALALILTGESVGVAKKLQFNPVGVWISNCSLDKSESDREPNKFIVATARDYAARVNKERWLITFDKNHKYWLPGEKGVWSIHGGKLLLTAKVHGGKVLRRAKQQSFTVSSSGHSFGLRNGRLIRLDFTRVANTITR